MIRAVVLTPNARRSHRPALKTTSILQISLVSGLALLLIGCGAEPLDVVAMNAAITDGKPHAGHPAVGYLDSGGSAGCTATLVGKRTVLSAAHCVWPDHAQTFVTSFGSYAVSSSVNHPSFDADKATDDVGLLFLSLSPPALPAAIAGIVPAPGLAVSLVGFGTTAESATDRGTKRIAANIIKEVAVTQFSVAGTGSGVGNICHHDSGGPAFASTGGQEFQIGVAIAGQKPCGTLGVWSRLDHYHPWIKKAAGGDLYDGAQQGVLGDVCSTAADCKDGLCVQDPDTGILYCTVKCVGGDSCGDGACTGKAAGAAVCGLPDALRQRVATSEDGCSVSAGPGPRRPVALAVPALVLLMLAATGRPGRARRGRPRRRRGPRQRP